MLEISWPTGKAICTDDFKGPFFFYKEVNLYRFRAKSDGLGTEPAAGTGIFSSKAVCLRMKQAYFSPYKKNWPLTSSM